MCFYRRRLRRVIAAPPNNLRVLREHLDPPKPRQVEFKAIIIAMTSAVNSTCEATVQAQKPGVNAEHREGKSIEK